MKNSPVETTITFLRHGSVENPQNILYGRIPGFTLSEKGKIEVVKTAEILGKQGISQIYTSPMKRARQSAAIIGKEMGIDPQVSYLLTEVRLFCQGMSIDKYHKFIQKNLYNEENIEKGQESVEHVASRMMKFVRSVFNKNYGIHILAVSHGDPIIILKAYSTGSQFTWDYKISHYIQPGKYLTLKIKNKAYEWT